MGVLDLPLGLPDIALLQMNIEGAEVFALHGMSATLAHTRKVCIACHDHRANRGESERFRTKDRVRRLLKKAGFDVQERHDTRDYVAGYLYGARK